MDSVTLFYIFSLLYLISTPPTRVNQMMLFYLMLGLAPHGMDLGFLGFGLLGLRPHPYFVSSFNFEKTRRKNFKFEGECPLPSLIKASFI